MSNSVYVAGQKVSIRRVAMSSRKKSLLGFDYRLQKQVEHSRKEWREELHKVVSHGGRRRHEHGETFGHNAKGLIEFEIYDNVSL
jgi:hypothetical protein